MTTRAPFYSRVPPRVHPVGLLTWTNTRQPVAAAAVTIAPRQSDWPMPGRAVPNRELLTWAHSSAVVPATVPPFVQKDWPVPRGARRSVELLTWTQRAPVVPAPVIPKDWPVPRGAVPSIALRTWIQSGPVVPAPVLPKDWPLPLPRPANVALRTWIQAPLPLPVLVAQGRTDPVPIQEPLNRALLTWTNTLPPVTALPAAQHEWPLPSRSAFQLWTWTQSPAPVSNLTEVPDVVGETQSAAEADIIADDFVPQFESDEYSATVAAGLVIRQSPAGGTQALIGSTVTYVLSLGPAPLGLPKFYRRYRNYGAAVQRGDKKPRR